MDRRGRGADPPLPRRAREGGRHAGGVIHRSRCFEATSTKANSSRNRPIVSVTKPCPDIEWPPESRGWHATSGLSQIRDDPHTPCYPRQILLYSAALPTGHTHSHVADEPLAAVGLEVAGARLHAL